MRIRNILNKPSDEEKETESNGIDRRSFLKTSAKAGAAVGAAALAADEIFGGDVSAEEAGKILNATTKTHDDFPYPILDSYKRFPQKNTSFLRGLSGRTPELGKAFQNVIFPKYREEVGHRQQEYALEKGGWALHDNFTPFSNVGIPNSQGFSFEGEVSPIQFRPKSNKEAADIVKRAAQFYGASLVGVTPYDERWVYSKFFNFMENREFPADLPFKPKSVIVMAVEMDYDAISSSPYMTSSATVGLAYSRMTFLSHLMMVFMRTLGYKAFGAGNDIALSIPYAIAAGLGELGRNGLLVTREFGPRVRLCKVFTDMEMEYDKPKTFGVVEFCKSCKRCADSCPSKAISQDDEPSFVGNDLANNPGVLKWCIKADQCLGFWGENHGDCSNCIATCPYNKPSMWHHKLVNEITTWPLGPGHKGMVEMDKIFGYGNTFDKGAVERFWKKGI